MKSLFTTILWVVIGMSYAQDFTIVEQFADEDEAVTARSMALAGAFSAVGADFSNATSNPAGMAFFRKKELGFGLGFQDAKSNANYLGLDNTDRKSIGQFNNFGFNYSRLSTEWINDSLVVKKKGLISWNIAAGMNQKADYNETIGFEAENPNSSLMSSYVESANQNLYSGIGLDEFENQALNVGLIDYNTAGQYYSSPFASGDMDQQAKILRNGARRDFFLSGGVNLNNKLYLGATLDMPWIHYEETKRWREEDNNLVYSDLDSYEVKEINEYDGTGGSFGVGLIYRFSDYFRMGGNIKTASVIDITQNNIISTEKTVDGSPRSVSSDYLGEYSLTLPFKAGLQLVASHPQYGLISLEGDYVDYTNSGISYQNDEFGDFDEYEESFKQNINDYYDATFNVRGGLELRLKRDFRLRGGVGYYGSPYAEKSDEFGADYSRLTFGLGLGYRHEPSNWAVDLGFNHSDSGEANTAYILNNSFNGAVTDKKSMMFRLNLTKRFNQ